MSNLREYRERQARLAGINAATDITLDQIMTVLDLLRQAHAATRHLGLKEMIEAVEERANGIIEAAVGNPGDGGPAPIVFIGRDACIWTEGGFVAIDGLMPQEVLI